METMAASVMVNVRSKFPSSIIQEESWCKICGKNQGAFCSISMISLKSLHKVCDFSDGIYDCDFYKEGCNRLCDLQWTQPRLRRQQATTPLQTSLDF